MAINTFRKIVVTLVRPKGESPYLEVDVPKEVTDITLHNSAQAIYWKLQFKGTKGGFNHQDNPLGPGFAWIGGHPIQGIFSRPVLFENGAILGINDLHNQKDKIGTWYYRLSATIDGVVYRTRFHEPFPNRVSVPREPPFARQAPRTRAAAKPAPERRVAVMRHDISMPTTTSPGLGTFTDRTASNPTIKNR